MAKPGSVIARASVYAVPLITFWMSMPCSSIHAETASGLL